MICSTIIPTIGRSTLQRAVCSVLDQELGSEEHEVIVVNDSGAPLPPAAWCDDPRVRIVTTNRCERSAARNVGAALAHGTYICFVDDDDYLLPGALWALLHAARAGSCNRTYGGLRCVNDEGRFVREVYPAVEGNIMALLLAGESIAMVGSLVHRKEFIAVGGFDQTLNVREDYDLECRLALVGDVARADSLVACVRVGNGFTSTDWSRMQLATRRAREKLLNDQQLVVRLRAAMADDFIRGRVCRTYAVSAAQHLRDWRPFVALERLVVALYLAGAHLIALRFWKGVAFTGYGALATLAPHQAAMDALALVLATPLLA